jgi:FixJ family two-component response regulator
MVLDVKMPKVNALGVMRKKAELGKSFPVVLLTGTIEEQNHIDEMEQYGLRAEDILYKPVDFPDLVEKIKRKLCVP